MKRAASLLVLCSSVALPQAQVNPYPKPLVPSSSGSSGTVTSVATGCGLAGGTFTTSGTIVESILTAAHNGSYAILGADCGKSLTTNTAAAWTIAQAGTTGFLAGTFWIIQNIGSGSLTVTATTSTFYGGPTANISGSVLTIPANTWAKIVSDATNYQVISGAGSSGGSSAFSALTGGTNTAAAMVVGTGASITVSGSGSNEATTLAGGGTNDLIYQAGAGTTGFLSPVNNAVLVTSATGVPSEAAATSPLAVSSSALTCTTCVVASSPGAGVAHFAGSTQTVTSGAVSLTADVTGILPIANGGIGAATAAQNSVFAGPASGGTGAPSFQTAPTISAANMTNFPTLNQNTTGTAANLSGTPALPNGTTATTQSAGTNNTTVATMAAVQQNANYQGAVNPIGAAGASQTIACTGGGVQSMTLSANLTITLTQPSSTTCLIRMEITQAGGGGDTVTITSAKWPGGIAPVMTATASAIDVWSCLLDGTTAYCTVGQNFK